MAVVKASRMPANFPYGEVAAICRKWGISRLDVFGSVASGQARQDSDVDLLYVREDPFGWDPFDLVEIVDEFQAALHRKVHFVSRLAVQRSANPARSRGILSEAVNVYTS